MIKVLFMAAIVMSLAITLTIATPILQEDNLLTEAGNPLGGPNRFLAQQRAKAKMTCDNYPRICRTKGSPGPDCCKKQCVNVWTDPLNCGMCGNKCKYTEKCCSGKCVNMSWDEKHCGSCNNKCTKGSSCTYGLCNYA